MPKNGHARFGLVLGAIAIAFLALGFLYRLYLGPTSVLDPSEKPGESVEASSRAPSSGIAQLFAQESTPVAQKADESANGEEGKDRCSEWLSAAGQTLESVPEEVSTLTSKEADLLAERVVVALRNCESFLKECAGPGTAEAHYFAAKFLHLLSRRQEDSIRNDAVKTRVADPAAVVASRMMPFYQRLSQAARSAFLGLDAADEARRSESLELLGFALGRTGDHRGAVEAYLEHQRTFTDGSRRAIVATALGRAYIDLGEFQTGIDALEKAIADPAVYEGESYPHVHEILWKLYENQGNLRGLERVVDRVETIFPLRLANPKITGDLRLTYERYIDVFGFRKAYAAFALGKSDEARELFRAHVQHLDAKRARLEASGRSLEPVSSIYRDRSLKCLDFIEGLHSQAAPVDFDLGQAWATAKQVRLATSRGSVVAVVFRGAGDGRSAPFLRELDAFAARTDGVELLSLSYLQKSGAESELERQLEGLRRELSDLGYRSAAGFDPDATAKSIFRTYGAYIGSATFVVFDREGRPAWYQQDPRPQDARFAEAIIDRLRG